MRLDPFEILSRLNASYWFVPLVVTVAGAALALILLDLDPHVTVPDTGGWSVLRPSSASGARELLSALIGAMITAISVTFSVSIVALTVAAQHFGARVLNSFVRHTSAQVVLGTFMATFVYSVIVLGAIEENGEGAIPELAVSGVVPLVIFSIGALIFYVHHVATSLQIGEITAEIAGDMEWAVTRVHAGADKADGPEATEIEEAPPGGAEVAAETSGYVQRIDFEAIVEAARTRGAKVWIRRETGAFVLGGTPIALVHPPGACDAQLADVIRAACITGKDRTLWHDAEFAVKQLVEIALRALSPGVNEPFTALTCIDRLAQGLACAAASPPPRARWVDADGVARVFSRAQPFGVLLRAAFDPIRLFGGGNPAVYGRLLDAVGEIALVAGRPSDREDLRHQADLVRRAADEALRDPDDRRYVAGIYKRTLMQIDGRPSPVRKQDE